jgi:signal transduction histidine kinase
MNNQSGTLEKVTSVLDDTNYLFPKYLSGLSHDIRTPLSAIVGFSDLLAEPRVSRTDQRSYCLMIARSSRKLLDLMSNLIDLAKMETGNLELFYKNVLFKDLIDDLKLEIDELRNLYEKNHLVMSYVIPADPSVMANMDKGRIFQILKILLDNSLRFTREGSINLVVSRKNPSGWTIEVSDTGSGIDKETLKNLFELFPSVDTQMGKKMKSRGMSLHVVKKLCDMMNIGIEVSSHVGLGTMFRLSIPDRIG